MIVVVTLAVVAVLKQSKVPQDLRTSGCPVSVYSPHGAYFKASCLFAGIQGVC
jgi:hypothetical protein